jgi:hypothetical protein
MADTGGAAGGGTAGGAAAPSGSAALDTIMGQLRDTLDLRQRELEEERARFEEERRAFREQADALAAANVKARRKHGGVLAARRTRVRAAMRFDTTNGARGPFNPLSNAVELPSSFLRGVEASPQRRTRAPARAPLDVCGPA